MRIGKFQLKNRVLLAPMAGITDQPFRRICARYHVALSYSEMMSANRDVWHTEKSRLRVAHHAEIGINAVQIAGSDPLENGAAAVAVHGRTRVQYYTGQADWDIIRDVKNAVSIPVIGNGDIFKGEDAVKMRDYTGCDGIMVARGAKGNPWIFREVKAALSGKPIPERPTEEEVISMLLRHAQLSVQYKGEKMGIREMRKHTAWYTTGMHGSSTLRNKVNQVETFDALQELLMR